jgi:phosphoserine phosphatase
MSRRLRCPPSERLRAALTGFAEGPARGRVCLVIDADRTLAPQDTGRIVGRATGVDGAIRAVFETHGYVEEAFTLVAETWAGVQPEHYLAQVLRAVDAVAVHVAWQTILSAAHRRVPVVVVTSGIPQAWRAVLDRLGHEEVPVIGGCHRDLDDYIVCPETKTELVAILQAQGFRVIAAGDSLIDLSMLGRADVPLFVPDPKGSPALRAELHRIPRIRHLLVDERRFDGLPTCSADDVARLIREGGTTDAD